MDALELRFYRFKLNWVKCPCGVSKRFTIGADARYFVDRHMKEHDKKGWPVQLLVFNNDEPVEESRTAKPGRHAGGVVHQNLY